MVRSLFSALGVLIRATLALFLIAGVIFGGFAGYKGSHSMHQEDANGMTYWQFMCERIGAIRDLPVKCQQMHFTGYLIAVPVYPSCTLTWLSSWTASWRAYPAASCHSKGCEVF